MEGIVSHSIEVANKQLRDKTNAQPSPRTRLTRRAQQHDPNGTAVAQSCWGYRGSRTSGLRPAPCAAPSIPAPERAEPPRWRCGCGSRESFGAPPSRRVLLVGECFPKSAPELIKSQACSSPNFYVARIRGAIRREHIYDVAMGGRSRFYRRFSCLAILKYFCDDESQVCISSPVPDASASR